MHRSTLAAASAALLFASLARAADAPPVVVTATRFHEVAPKTPANAVVITREEILGTPATNLPDVLRLKAGLEMRSLYGSQAIDVTADLRGFGDTGNSHVLVLVNGRRVNPIDLGPLNWSAIPLESIERVEVIRGSGAVLFGEGAVGGVINVITTGPQARFASVTANAGSFGSRGADANLAGSAGAFSYQVFANYQTSDEYRRNNQTDQKNLSGRLSFLAGSVEGNLEFGVSGATSGLPGVVTAAQYEHDPRAAQTPDSWQSRDAYVLRPGIRWRTAAGVEVAAEFSADDTTSRAWFSNFFTYLDTRIRQHRFTPRVRWDHGGPAGAGHTVVGIDWEEADLGSDQGFAPGAPVARVLSTDQSSRSVYFQSVIDILPRLTLTAGARYQSVDQEVRDSTVPGALDNRHAETIGEAGLSFQATPALRLFAKVGSTFRFPKTDELTTFFGLGAPLKPETGVGADLGAEWRSGRNSVQLTLYDLRLDDEIAFNQVTFQNENLEATRHRGVEIDARAALGAGLTVAASLGFTEARFRGGDNAGKDIPLVARHKAAVTLGWQPGPQWAHALVVAAVGDRPYGGDNANARPRLAGYATVDWQSEYRWQRWTATLKVMNLLDRKYAPTAYDFGFGGPVYYPANPRAGYVTLRHDFY